MQTKNFGLLLRCFAKTHKDVNEVVERAIVNISFATKLDIFSEIIILIPVDYDCGYVYAGIHKKLVEKSLYANVRIIEATGNHSSKALNTGLNAFYLNINKVVIISGKAMSYLTNAVIKSTAEAFDSGASVVGVVMPELEDFVLSGRVQNTFAAWDLPGLLSVNGFQTNLGVEEIDPLVRLVQTHGKCIAVLDPKKKPKLNIRKSKDGTTRHNEVMNTKLAHQQEEVDRLGVDFDFIKGGIMDGYPKKI